MALSVKLLMNSSLGHLLRTRQLPTLHRQAAGKGSQQGLAKTAQLLAAP